MQYDINDELYEKCKKFANDRIEISKGLYAYRGENNKDKMVEDIIIGTLGEWGIYEHLTSLGYTVSEPDMVIYENKRKSYSADLCFDEVNIHVKSQGVESVKKYGNSWLLQRSDKVVKNPTEFDIFAFTSVDLETMKINILGYCWATDMKYGECKVPRYRSTKVAIYVNQIEDQLIRF